MLRAARTLPRVVGSMPKRTASTAAGAAAPSTQPKRARASKAPDTDAPAPSPAAPSGVDHVAPDWVPRNKELPGTLSFARPAEGDVRIAIWNITSLKSSDAKGLMRYIHAEDPDVLVLSETKVRARDSRR